MSYLHLNCNALLTAVRIGATGMVQSILAHA